MERGGEELTCPTGRAVARGKVEEEGQDGRKDGEEEEAEGGRVVEGGGHWWRVRGVWVVGGVRGWRGIAKVCGEVC